MSQQSPSRSASGASQQQPQNDSSWISQPHPHSPKNTKVMEQAGKFGGAVGAPPPVGKIFDVDRPVQSAKNWQKHIKHAEEHVVTNTEKK
jgi:hypothetical protein